MSDPSLTPLEQRVRQLVTQALQQSNPTGWFESLYAEAQGDTTQIPWAKLAPYPYLQDWLSDYLPLEHSKSAIVIGCGLGDDAEALADSGFQVTAFDISPTAIAWCRQRFPQSQVDYHVADLFHLDESWHQDFDLVFECRNIQALPLSLRSEAIAAVANLVAPEGYLLVVTHFRTDEAEPDGPPWPLSNLELAQFTQLGLQEIDRQILASRHPSVQVVGVVYQR